MFSRPTTPQILSSVVCATAFCVVAPSASGAPLPADGTAILSGNQALTAPLATPVSSSYSSSEAVSVDGRYVAFTSESDGLAAGDDDRVRNAFLKDRETGAVILVSRRSGANGEPAHDDCDDAVISDDGRRVAFSCEGALDDADDNGHRDVYVRDIAAETTTLVSRKGGLGPVGDRFSTEPSISATGEYVAFTSIAHNLDPAATDGDTKVYRRRIGSGDDVRVVSRRAALLGATPAPAVQPSISDDGNRVAFNSNAQLVADDLNQLGDVFVRDIEAGATILASRNAVGDPGNGYSRTAAIAGDGNSVAFQSNARNLAPTADSDSDTDIYRRTLTGTETTTLVSVTAGGVKGNDSSTEPTIDRSGRFVGFISSATSLSPADPDPGETGYVKDVGGGALHLVSRDDGGAGRVANDVPVVALSGDATKAVSTQEGSTVPGADPRVWTVALRDLTAVPQRTHAVSRPAGNAPFRNSGGSATDVKTSADGRFIVFVSSAPGLGLPDDVRLGVFVRDRVTGAVTLASRADGPNGAPFTEWLDEATISADGRRAAWIARDDGPRGGVWVRDLARGQTWRASRADGPDGAPADDESQWVALDADGSRVSFSTYAKGLVSGDNDAAADVYVRDLSTDRTILVSRANGPAGAKGSEDSESADISADGTRVAFVSNAPNLDDGDNDNHPDVHLRDLRAGTTRLVSANVEGEAFTTTIDASGTRVAFDAQVPILPTRSYVRDLRSSTPVLVSRATGATGAPANDNAFDPQISGDGGSVAFTSTATNLAPGTAPVVSVYHRDVVANTTRLVSRASGPGGAQGDDDSYANDITANGACVTFAGRNLVGSRSDFIQAYVRAIRAECGVARPAPQPRPGAGQTPRPQPRPSGGDRTAPVLSRVRVSPRRFRARRGAMLRFRSSEAARLTITVERARRGRSLRFRRVGVLSRRIGAGPGRAKLRRRIGRRRLTAGRYRLRLVARDAAGNRSKPRRVTVTVLKP